MINSELPQHSTPIYMKLHLERRCVYHMPPFKELLTKQNMLFFIIMALISVINKLALAFSRKNMELPLLHSDYLCFFKNVIYMAQMSSWIPNMEKLENYFLRFEWAWFSEAWLWPEQTVYSINYWCAKMKEHSILHHYLWTRALFLEQWGMFYSTDSSLLSLKMSWY